MQSVFHHVVLPLLRGRYGSVGTTLRMPRPEDHPRAHSAGIDPDRILVFGNGAAVGWGVRSHQLGLPGHLARRLSTVTGRGVDVEVAADPRLTIANAALVVPDEHLATFDAIVVVIGVSDALRLTSVKRWRAGMTALLDTLQTTGHDTAEIVVVGITRPSEIAALNVRPGSVVDGHADRLDRITRELVRDRPRVTHVPAPALPEGPADTAAVRHFDAWGVELATVLAPLLDGQVAREESARSIRNLPQGDERRLRALRALGLLDSAPEKRFDDIAERARVLLGTATAAFSLVDEDRLWNKALAGGVDREVPLRGAMCAVTISSGRPFIVPDVWRDDRFVTHPAVRFYAGHPVETTDGIRIGALCVTDPEPRAIETVDLVLLRELALSVQRELAEYERELLSAAG